jgi:transcription termination factor Rho
MLHYFYTLSIKRSEDQELLQLYQVWTEKNKLLKNHSPLNTTYMLRKILDKTSTTLILRATKNKLKNEKENKTIIFYPAKHP